MDPKLGKKVVITCHYCGEVGHKVSHCSKMPQELRDQQMSEPGKTFMPYTQSNYRMHPMVSLELIFIERVIMSFLFQSDGRPHRFKTLDEITCFKCGENGHFANKCPKGHLAFLSNNQSK